MQSIVAVGHLAAAWPRGLRAGAAAVLLASVTFALPGCAWLEAKQVQLALRPTPGKPAGLPPDEQLFRPGDQRFLLPVPAAPAPAAGPARGRGAAGGEATRSTAGTAGGASPSGETSPSGAATQHVALWWLPHPDPQAPVLLYLHGTFRNLYQNLSKIDALRDAGFAIVAVDYRGWGESTPIVPSEDSIAADARLAWGEVQRRQPDARRRVIFGHSMGGAVAVRLASTLRAAQVPVAAGPGASAGSAGQGAAAQSGALQGGAVQGDYGALVLESTFTRMPDVAGAAGFWGRVAAFVTTLRFDSASRIGDVDAPVLMLHGTADTTVPVELGRRLRDQALQGRPPSVRWVEVPGGTHSRLHTQAAAQYRQAFAGLIEQLGLPNPPPRTRPP